MGNEAGESKSAIYKKKGKTSPAAVVVASLWSSSVVGMAALDTDLINSHCVNVSTSTNITRPTFTSTVTPTG
jgi:hypothetical protein